MPLVRLATVADYEPFDFMGRTMYRVSWCDRLCPGNPSEDPAAGAALFNEWQCAIAAGHDPQLDPGKRLELIVEWCLNTSSIDAFKLAKEIVTKFKKGTELITLEFSQENYSEPALAYRYELAFLNKQVMELSAETVLKLQNLSKGS